MATSTTQSDQFADVLKNDILRRQLSPGDRYFTETEAAGKFGVSARMANRALGILAKEKVIVRRRRAGTFVGPAIESKNILRCIYLLYPAEMRYSGRPIEQFAMAIHQEMPEIGIQINLFPSDDPISLVQRLVEQSKSNGTLQAMVLALAPREVHQYLVDFEVPAVVVGSPWPGIDGLATIDADWRQMGYLLAQNLIRQGHRRIGLVMRSLWSPGDNLLLDGVTQALEEANFSAGALSVVSCGFETNEVASAVTPWLASRSPITGLICYEYDSFYEGINQAAASLNKREGEDFAIVSPVSAHSKPGSRCPLVVKGGTQAYIRKLIQMLSKISRGDEYALEHEVIPVIAK